MAVGKWPTNTPRYVRGQRMERQCRKTGNREVVTTQAIDERPINAPFPSRGRSTSTKRFCVGGCASARLERQEMRVEDDVRG